MRNRIVLSLGALYVTAAAAIAVPLESQSLEVGEVLASARTALGWKAVEQAAAVRVRGKARIRGTSADQVELFDAHGRWLQTFEGPLPGKAGSDGSTVWAVDWNRTPRVMELGDLASSQTTAALLSGAWAGGTAPLDFESAHADADGLHLTFAHAAGILHGEIQLDESTHLPISASFNDGSEDVDWVFTNFEEYDGFRFPAEVRFVQSGSTQVLQTESVELLAAVEHDAFAPQLDWADDTRFDADVPATIETRRARSGHLLVHPTVEGKDLGWFIFDSGAGVNCISTHVAGELAGAGFGEIPAKGVGGTVMSQLWRAESIELGPVTVHDPVFVGLDLEFLSQHFGVEIAGIVGFDFIARCAVEVDFAEGEISLHDPALYELDASGQWEELLLYARHPCVRAQFEGRSGVFKIDTGAAADTVTMHYQAVQEFKLTEGRETQPSRAGGVGGSIATRTGELSSFVLGGHDFGVIPASFTAEDNGAFSDDYTLGNIGGKLIEPFRLVFDYQQKRIGFLPKASIE